MKKVHQKIMKKLEKILKGHKHIVFLDFEGTQYSAEMIAIGAIAVTLDRNGLIKNRKPPITIYVKAKNKIGKFVTELTGITEDMLKEKGVSFLDAMKQLKKYVGMSFNKSTFITYNNHDMRILNQSIAYNLDYPKDICSQIHKNYFDFAAFFDDYIKDKSGNSLSLVHACELFEVELAKPAHDPANDAINLANLYNAFLIKRDIVLNEYKKTLSLLRHIPEPVKAVLVKLNNNEHITPEDYDTILKESLK